MYKPLQQVQIGTLAQLQKPACMPYDALKANLFIHQPESLPLAANIAEATALQLLTQHDSGAARLMLFEASASPYFVQLKRLFAASEQTWGEQFYTAKQCLQYLTTLEELTHRRFALLAQAGVDDIHAYNAQAVRPEQIIYCVISGLGAALSEPQPLQQLQLLCDRAATVGITLLLLHNAAEIDEAQLPDYRARTLQVFWTSIADNALGLNLTDPVKPIQWPEIFWSLLQRFGVALGVDANTGKAWADKLIALGQAEVDDDTNSDFLHIAIGLTGATPAYFSMGERSDAYHALIGGATRTGKTTLLNNLILSACEQYTPEALQLTLMDFKDGVSFWEYEGLAHVAQLYAPVSDDFAQALSCLEQFEQQISLRYAQFRTQRVARLADYNQTADDPLPRCLLVVDEAQSLFEGRDFKQKAAIKRLISNIAKKGAAAGMHMMLSTQSFQNVELDGDVRDQFHLRMGLRHASAMGCRALMGRENEAMLHLPRFSAIYNSHQGDDKHNRVVALDDVPDFLQRLDVLKQRYPSATNNEVNIAVKSTKSSHKPDNPYASGDVSVEWD